MPPGSSCPRFTARSAGRDGTGFSVRHKWWAAPAGDWCAASARADYKELLSMVCGWSPPTGAGSCCDLQSSYLTGEINYCWQMSSSKGKMGKGGGVEFDWHGRSSQHVLPEGIIADLVMPGVLGTPSPFSNTALVFLFSKRPLFWAGL